LKKKRRGRCVSSHDGEAKTAGEKKGKRLAKVKVGVLIAEEERLRDGNHVSPMQKLGKG